MIVSILVGIGLATLTIGVHSLATVLLIRWLTKKASSVDSKKLHGFWWQLRMLCLAAALLLLVHLLEVILWAVVYLIITPVEPIHNLETSIYFSAVSFTSLGYGDIVLAEPWRLLSAIQAMTGILVCGWSTALVFAVVHRIWIVGELPGNKRSGP